MAVFQMDCGPNGDIKRSRQVVLAIAVEAVVVATKLVVALVAVTVITAALAPNDVAGTITNVGTTVRKGKKEEKRLKKETTVTTTIQVVQCGGDAAALQQLLLHFCACGMAKCSSIYENQPRTKQSTIKLIPVFFFGSLCSFFPLPQTPLTPLKLLKKLECCEVVMGVGRTGGSEVLAVTVFNFP